MLPAASGMNAIYSVPQWRSKFSVLAAYVIDSWYIDWFGPEARLFDYLFVSRAEDVEPVRARTRRPTYHLPVGADVLGAAPWVASHARTNDLLVYGRQPPNYNYDVVEGVARDAGLSVQLRVPADMDPARNQVNLFKAISHAKFALAFCNTVHYHFDLPGVGSFLTFRWLDILAGGATVAGVLPRPRGYETTVGWEGAHLELPADVSEGMATLAEQVRSYDPLVGIRNHYESLVRNDWRLRLRDIFAAIGLEMPLSLKTELKRLEEYRTSLLSTHPRLNEPAK